MKLSANVAFVALLCVFVVLATAFSMIIPLGEAADEVSHHSYVRYVALHWALPPVQEGTSVFGETFQPPLYYALAAPLTGWLPYGDERNLGFSNPVENNPDWELGHPERARVLLQPAAARWPWEGEALGWHLVRFFSVLLGVITLLATYRLAALVFPDEAWTPLLAAAIVAFLPSFTGLSAAVTNDALITSLSALLLWQLARLVVMVEHASWLVQVQSQWRAWAIVGVLGALAVWTKASGWVFVGTTVLAAMLICAGQIGLEWFSIPRQRPLAAALRDTILHLFTTFCVWLLLVIPLWMVNLQRAGDILGRGVQQQVTEARTHFPWAEWWSLIEDLYRTWWAGFGGAVHLHFPAWVQGLLLLPLLMAGWGLLKRHTQRDNAPAATRLLIPLLGAHVGMVIALWLLWSTLVMGTGQGRLLFPALSAIAVLLAGGLVSLTRTRRREAALAWSVGALALALAALFTILLPTYRVHPITTLAPPSANHARWQVAELPLTLTAFNSSVTIDDRVKPGSDISLYVAWQAEESLPDVRLRLRWIDKHGKLLMIKEGSPIANHPLTDEWEPGDYAAYHHMRLPDQAEAGWYRLLLSVIDHTTGDPLPLQAPDGSRGPEIMVGQMTMVTE